MAKFEFLNKNLLFQYANRMFEIIADNMSVITPTEISRDEDFRLWYHYIGESIEKDNRKIILILENETNHMIGYFQYSTTVDAFMMEEIQIRNEYQSKDNIFRDLYGYVLKNISNDLLYVEAYANKLNHKSIGILGKLGLKVVGENKSGKSFHFKGSFEDLTAWHLNRTRILE